jgi:hypothetical protein
MIIDDFLRDTRSSEPLVTSIVLAH